MSATEQETPVSLFDAATQQCPFPFYQWLRNEAPVYWDAEIGCHIVSRYDTIRAIALDTKTFSNIGMLTPPARSCAAAQADAIRATTYPTVPMLVANDPPEHGIYRRISNTILSPRRMKAAAPLIEEMLERFLAPFLAKGGGDFIHQVAGPLPVAVICRMLGIPADKWQKCRDWSDALMDSLSGMASAEREVECAELFVERQSYFAGIITRLRAHGGPEDDMLTGVALARTEDGALLPMPEALTLVEQLLVAGGETTTDALGMGLLQLARASDLLAALREDDSRVDNFVEEILRLYAPPQGAFRIVTQDTDIDGTPVTAGSKVMLRWAAGNRDERIFPDSEALDLDRRNARMHLTFGYGIHTCQGAQLARMELAAMFRTIARNVSKISIADPDAGIQYKKSVMNMGLARLDLRVLG